MQAATLDNGMRADLDIAVASAAPPRVRALAEGLTDELKASGQRVALFVDRLPPVGAGRTMCLFVPHVEFDRWATANAELVSGRLRHALAICPGSIGHDAARALRDARGVVALLPGARHLLRLAGIDATPLPLGWRGETAAERERDLDVVVCESWTPGRWRVMARCARVLDGRVCDLRASYVGGIRAGVEHLPDNEGRRALLRRARVALVVGNGPSLDVLAAIEAAACGAVVVTDARVDLAPFTPGVHLVRADEHALPTVLDRLLEDPDRLARVRSAAAALVSRSPLSTTAAAVAKQAGSRLIPPRRPSSVRGGESQAVPDRPRIEPPPGLVGALTEVRRLRRRVDRLAQRSSSSAEQTIVSTPAWDRPESPELTVVIPLHDYEEFVEAAVASAMAARDVRLEIVVIDDASVDRGADRVEALLAARPNVPATLLRLPSNVGIADVRNRGADLARSPLLLFLDADDVLLPHGPALMRNALALDPGAAFSYGLLAVEGHDGPVGLLNAEPWNPDLLRDGNYVNALALVRASAFRDVGGYLSDGPLELGWEDYDLWLRMASAGFRGAHVRQIVARYRMHGESRTLTADLVASDLMAFLRSRHPSILGDAAA